MRGPYLPAGVERAFSAIVCQPRLDCRLRRGENIGSPPSRCFRKVEEEKAHYSKHAATILQTERLLALIIFRLKSFESTAKDFLRWKTIRGYLYAEVGLSTLKRHFHCAER